MGEKKFHKIHTIMLLLSKDSYLFDKTVRNKRWATTHHIKSRDIPSGGEGQGRLRDMEEEDEGEDNTTGHVLVLELSGFVLYFIIMLHNLTSLCIKHYLYFSLKITHEINISWQIILYRS